MTSPPMPDSPSPRTGGNQHASSMADLAMAVVLAVAALIGHARYGDEEFGSPLQYALWALAAAFLARAVVRWAAIELTGTGAR